MKTKKQLLSILLSLALMLGLLPGMSLTAFAEGTETPAYSGGTGTEADPYLISTVDNWKALAASVNGGEAYEGKYFRQTADLNMSGVDGLAPVGTLAKPFAGNYEGDGFAISNATISGVTTDESTVAGVFGVLTGKGSISNLIVENATVTATQGSGGWDMAFAGGLVAVVEDAALTDCSVSGSSVTAGGGSDTFSGAVVGYAQSENGEVTTISQIASTNNTVVGGGYGGGVLGSFSNEGTLSMTNCYAVGSNVSAQTYSNAQMGAFLGNSQGGDISLTNCFVYDCSVNATSSTFGKAGLFAGDIIQEGKVSATTTYYYDTNNLPANAESATSKTVNDMKSLASTLGEAFTQGSDYPILLHPVNLAVSIEGWAYGRDANEPSVTRNSSGTPAYTYADKGTTDFSATVPSNAGNYTVKATVEKTATHKAAEATADFTIAKVDAAVTTAPTAKTLTANGQAQALVTSGEAEGGTMYYAVTTENTAPTDDNLYTTAIPTGTNAGTYYVWYKVIGDPNHNAIAPACVTVNISYPVVVEDPVKQVIDKIEALKEPYDEAAVKDAREAYENLTKEQKEDTRLTAEVMKKLTDAESALAAKSVSDKINALPAADKVTTADKAAIEEARQAYEALSADQKARISAEMVKKLEDAESALAAAVEKSVKTVTLNSKTVSAKTLESAVAKAGGSSKYVTTIVLGKKVKKISKGAFKNYKKTRTLIIKTKKLKKAKVKQSLKSSKITKVKVKVGKQKVNKKYVKKYKKIFTKKNAGKKVKVSL